MDAVSKQEPASSGTSNSESAPDRGAAAVMGWGPFLRRLALVALLSFSGVLVCRAHAWPAYAQPQPVPSAQRFGEYTVFYSAVPADTLPPSMLRRYALPPGDRTVVLNVAVQRAGKNVPARIDARVVNLAEEVRSVRVREDRTDGMVAYLGVLRIAEPQADLSFELEIVPEGARKPLEVRFRRDFMPVPDTSTDAGTHGVGGLER